MSEKTDSQTMMQSADEVAEAEIQARADNLLRDLKSVWGDYHQVSLTVRHQTGQKINAECGLPSETRQKYGAKILERVATALELHRSDISRMRTFAEAYPDLDAFLQDHPECSTWTRVKEHLARLNADGQLLPKAKTNANGVKTICRSFSQLTENLTKAETLSQEDWKLIQENFKTLSAAYQAADKRFNAAFATRRKSRKVTSAQPDSLPGKSAV